MSKCKAAIKHLDYLYIMLFTGWGYESRLTARAELGECKEQLSKGDLVELASAAKNLRTLDIAFDGKFPSPAILKYVVGNATWAHLRTVNFDKIDAFEDDLVHFLQRHTGTIRDLGIRNMILVEGNWISALPQNQGRRQVGRVSCRRVLGGK